MNESRLGHSLEPLKELLYQKEDLLEGYKKREGVTIAGITCDFIPIEILASFNIFPSRLPLPTGKGCGAIQESDNGELPDIYDVVIIPQQCCNYKLLSVKKPLYEFENPAGYGNDHSEALHYSMERILKEINNSNIKDVDIALLKRKTEEYNNLRRIIRGITSERSRKPDLLSNADLFIIFNAASMLPPGIISDFLIKILKDMNETESSVSGKQLNALIYSSSLKDVSILDGIEEEGCIIAEDDTCNGRRQFDLSFNPASDYIYYEILDAYSYKPLCPSIRPVEERYELFYKLLRNHGIDFVILLTDEDCCARSGDVDFLRKKLMRLGVDPVTGTGETVVDNVGVYLERI